MCTLKDYGASVVLVVALFIQMILGKPVARPAELDLEVAKEIYECSRDCDFPTMLGGTLCTDDFYEGLVTLYIVSPCNSF